MKVKYIGKKSDPLLFIKDKVYEKVGDEHGFWRVVDETGEDYLYSPGAFEELTDEEYEELMKQPKYREHKCPVCGKSDFSMENSGEMCSVCGWADFDQASWNGGLDVEAYKKLFNDEKVKYGDWSYFHK